MKTSLNIGTGVLLILYTLTFTMCASQKNIPRSSWNKTPVQINGDLSDWGDQLRFYDKPSKILYSVLNDSTNLYFCLRVSNKTMQMKILRAGMFIGLDTIGKKGKHISINYPLAGNVGFLKDDRTSRPNFDEQKREFKQNVQLMMLSGFNKNNGLVPLQVENGVVVKLDWDQNNDMVYEMCIPFSVAVSLTVSKELVRFRAPMFSNPS